MPRDTAQLDAPAAPVWRAVGDLTDLRLHSEIFALRMTGAPGHVPIIGWWRAAWAYNLTIKTLRHYLHTNPTGLHRAINGEAFEMHRTGQYAVGAPMWPFMDSTPPARDKLKFDELAHILHA